MNAQVSNQIKTLSTTTDKYIPKMITNQSKINSVKTLEKKTVPVFPIKTVRRNNYISTSNNLSNKITNCHLMQNSDKTQLKNLNLEIENLKKVLILIIFSI